ncbi:PMC2NT (NUC016) domain protein [Nostoc sp. PCC 7524]|uniref:PMC2NT domain-containing protein n=1 Tax=Nostoc sp. (strain ATCC 29411 / PCC 7524) TaxID=28072 RepID=UPI00029EEEFD|nr:PMC2NT domain-containing protein [Nostoc sp. PCC 7524]AFY49203.1 PMC2NT (NUC016) domain protein [Nostoc sp. PCC 7524]
MTNSQPLEDITARVDDIDQRLDQLGDEIDLVRTIQEGVRRETRSNSQALARLERTVTNLADIARLHQQALRQSERQFQEFQRTTNAALERVDRVLDYLIRQSGGQSEG